MWAKSGMGRLWKSFQIVVRLVICVECHALTTMGIVSKSWPLRGASHILTTHTRTHKPLYPSQRDQTAQQRPFKRSGVRGCVSVLEECLCVTHWGKWTILAHAHTAPVQTADWVTNLFSFSFSHCRVCLGVMMTAEYVCGACFIFINDPLLHLYHVWQIFTQQNRCFLSNLSPFLKKKILAQTLFLVLPAPISRQTAAPALPARETPWPQMARQTEGKARGIFHSTACQVFRLGVWAALSIS